MPSHDQLLRCLAIAMVVGTACATADDPGETGSPDPEGDAASERSTVASLGKRIFFDTTLSEPRGQSCATCHDPARAFADPRPGPTSEGATPGRFGVRNTPSIVYASFCPELTSAQDEAGYSGGLFFDGRAPTLETQVPGPLLHPLEMNNPSAEAVVAKIRAGAYASVFRAVFGNGSLDDVEVAFAHVAEALAAYERTGMRKRFTSRYDAYLRPELQLTAQELRGLTLFEDPLRGNCASCHLDKPAADGSPPLFTDFGYDNLGIPRNPDNRFYGNPVELNPLGDAFVDHGLSGAIINPRQNGKFKAPTLRNLALTAPYGHNGYFPDLKSIVHFYNSRDVVGEWPAPEVDFDLNTVDMGNLGLSDADENDLVAFLLTLTDGHKGP